MRNSAFPASPPDPGHVRVAHALYAGEYCPLACETTINYVTFNDTPPSSSWLVNRCRSDMHITSVYLCFDEFCTRDGAIADWIKTQSSACYQTANVTLPPLQRVLQHWQPHEKAKVERLRAQQALKFPSLSHMVIPEHAFFQRALSTVETAAWEYKIHLVYGWYMYYFWAVVVATGVATHLCSLICELQYKKNTAYPRLLRAHRTTSAPTIRSILASFQSRWRRHVSMPAAFGHRCSRPYGWCTIPPRLQSLTILLFLVLNVALCSCSYRLTQGNLYWPQKSAQLLRYVSDRTGIISLANFPLVWLFGMRNDALIWITGWGFGTYNAFHRWVARLATLQAVVHSLGYTVMILEREGWPSFQQYWTQHYFWNGEIATIAMCALLAFSLYGIRRKHYDMFLITHISLSIAALWSMYYHVEIFTAGEWNIFIWPCLVIWILDRTLRLVRIFAFSRRPLSTGARATYDSASNLVRLDVDGSQTMMPPQPGSYYYIHLLDDILYAHQNHPFTLAFVSSDVASPAAPLTPLTSSSGQPYSLSASSTESDTLLANDVVKTPSNLVFLVRPYNGFTRRLKSSCLLHPKTLRVLVDGPYGHSIPLRGFASVLFVVGGTGITVPLSYLAHLLSDPSSPVLRVKIAWAVREHGFLASVLRDFQSLLSDERVELEVHITRDDELKDEVLADDLQNFIVMPHRPDVYQLVKEAAEKAQHEQLAVVGCGPATMADDARQASVHMLAVGFTGIEYFEESFKW
ncbi:uncharacterized protein SETTUDRAFT_94116 [Exserohilum turcica Et28A]|uniref:FAD-binding FR-type domain-containing protein n=1 Tax=Exserohilum turcicum (strain 28A) TaxID=671987 RepID=R0IF25_EXST2|nr:uncharacterized protein SETTUDRAFT_94116 [Exserohilum turcica Et28A]EOA83661.1 hypothetical protein SETTUDRAFT_94116 [Exserohilum turcica Et28A]